MKKLVMNLKTGILTEEEYDSKDILQLEQAKKEQARIDLESKTKTGG